MFSLRGHSFLSAKQRQGRAGRVQEGTCYKLFSRAQYERFAQRETPEIQRVPLEQICLQIKLLQLGRIADVLAMTIEPPQIAAIQETIKVQVTQEKYFLLVRYSVSFSEAAS